MPILVSAAPSMLQKRHRCMSKQGLPRYILRIRVRNPRISTSYSSFSKKMRAFALRSSLHARSLGHGSVPRVPPGQAAHLLLSSLTGTELRGQIFSDLKDLDESVGTHESRIQVGARGGIRWGDPYRRRC